MLVDVVLNPAEIALLPERDLAASTCVIFDVLRATSSMITGLAHGAEAIYPARSIAEAFALKERFPEAILGGERHGERIEGFAIGNSPFEYRQDLEGRTVITTTTNGTLALRACEHAPRVLVGALLNLRALVDEILRLPDTKACVIVCAGTFENFALEDACAAGMLVEALRTVAEVELSDSAQAAWAITRLYPAPLDALRAATNGRVLLSKDRGAEVEWCAQVSIYDIVGSMEQAMIRALPARPHMPR